MLAPLERRPLRDIGLAPVEPGLFVVPEHEPDRALSPDIRRREHASQLQYERGPRAVVVRGLTEADATTRYISSGCVVPIFVQ